MNALEDPLEERELPEMRPFVFPPAREVELDLLLITLRCFCPRYFELSRQDLFSTWKSSLPVFLFFVVRQEIRHLDQSHPTSPGSLSVFPPALAWLCVSRPVYLRRLVEVPGMLFGCALRQATPVHQLLSWRQPCLSPSFHFDLDDL